jgi:hypothetical protein
MFSWTVNNLSLFYICITFIPIVERPSWPWSYGSVACTTTCATGAYHHWYCEFESRSGWRVQHYVIKFVSDLGQIGGFLWVLRFPPPNKTDRHDIAEILLKVALNIIKPTYSWRFERKLYNSIYRNVIPVFILFPGLPSLTKLPRIDGGIKHK